MDTVAAPRPRLRDYLELVKFSHTIFALPFALGSMLVASRGLPPLEKIGWILLAMVGARTAGMGFNRIVDREIDARNPRTASREIPSGKVSIAQAWGLVVLSSALFVFAAWKLNPLAFVLSVPTLGWLFFYSLCKRFTHFSHFVLGVCLGIAPAGAWIAVRDISSLWQLEAAPIVLCFAVVFWVAGFDVIYATMDEQFDREAGLHSLVQKLGIPRALLLTRFLHLTFLALLAFFGFLTGAGAPFWATFAVIAGFLIYEHALVRPGDLKRVNTAFFSVNGLISGLFLLGVLLDLWL